MIAIISRAGPHTTEHTAYVRDEAVSTVTTKKGARTQDILRAVADDIAASQKKTRKNPWTGDRPEPEQP